MSDEETDRSNPPGKKVFGVSVGSREDRHYKMILTGLGLILTVSIAAVGWAFKIEGEVGRLREGLEAEVSRSRNAREAILESERQNDRDQTAIVRIETSVEMLETRFEKRFDSLDQRSVRIEESLNEIFRYLRDRSDSRRAQNYDGPPTRLE